MGINKTYAVLGLGKYGFAVASELSRAGAEVLAVDSDENLVNLASQYIPLCKCADVTDEEVLRQLGISNFDVVIIAMARSLESSVMTTTLCKEAGVETVIVKCANEMHKKILLRVGADKVVVPELESGLRMARNLISSGFVDMIELSDNVSMVEISVRSEWVGKTLLELHLRRKYSINVVAIISDSGEVAVDIDPEKPLDSSMKLMVIADTAKLKRLSWYISAENR